MGHSKPQAKGAAFERRMCMKLSLWVSRLTREDVFWRSAMSGGRAKIRSRHKRGTKFCAQAGDISAIHSCGEVLLDNFMIECKHYAKLKLGQLCYGHNGFIEELWLKPLRDAHAIGREPMIIAKENMKPELVFTTRRGLELLNEGTGGDKQLLPIRATFRRGRMLVLMLRDVLTDVDFDKVRKSKQWNRK